MSTAANKQKRAERENEKEIQKGISLVKSVWLALTITWIAVVIGIILVDKSHKTVVDKTNRLADQDAAAAVSVQALDKDTGGLKEEMDGLIDTSNSPSVERCLKDNVRYMSEKTNILRSYEGFQEWNNCLEQCKVHPQCMSWTFIKPNSGIEDQEECHLKDNYGKQKVEIDVYSGLRHCKVERLLNYFTVEFDKQNDLAAGFREFDKIFATYSEGYGPLHYLKFKSPIIEIGPNSAAAAAAASLLTCPENNVEYLFPSVDRIGSYKQLNTFMECSDHCISLPECKYWIFYTPAMFATSSRSRSRSRSRTPAAAQPGRCYTAKSITESKNRTNIISADRRCFDHEVRDGFKRYAQYHANFIGYGCHFADCNLASATSTHVIKETLLVQDCISACYSYQFPVYELTYKGLDSECYCHYYSNSTGPMKHNFYGGGDFKEKYLKYTLF